MKKLPLLFLLFSFTAQAQLHLIHGGNTTVLVHTSGGTYAPALPLTANSILKTLDDKEYTISGNITGPYSLTAELVAGSKLTLTGSPTYTGATAVTGGELILTNTQNFRSFNWNVSAGAALTISSIVANTLALTYSGSGRHNSYPVFGSDFTTDFRVTGAGQVNFKGNVNCRLYSDTNKTVVFRMAEGGLLNFDGGDAASYHIGALGVEAFPNTNLGSIHVTTPQTNLYIYGTTAQFDKVTGKGRIYNYGSNNLAVKIGAADGTCEWDGDFWDHNNTAKLSIEKVGSGTISFTEANHKSGATTISKGILSTGNGKEITNSLGHSRLGGLDIIIQDTATMIVNLSRKSHQHDSYFHKEWISGTGNFIKKGDRSVRLSVGFNNTAGILQYTGRTTVESGELILLCEELKNSAIIVKDSATLATTATGIGDQNRTTTNEGVITSAGPLSMKGANSTLHVQFTEHTHSYAKLVVPHISAPHGFLIRFSGSASTTLSGPITLIQCTGDLPTILPTTTIVENSIDFGPDARRRCITLMWERHTKRLVATISTGSAPAITSTTPPTICIGDTKGHL